MHLFHHTTQTHQPTLHAATAGAATTAAAAAQTLTMGRIIDKIRARRKEFQSEREEAALALAAARPPRRRRSPPAADVPSHIRNRPLAARRTSPDRRAAPGAAAPNDEDEGNGGDAEEDGGPSSSSSSAVLRPGWHYSFEYFPPKTEPGLDNLLARIERMSRRLDPLFVSVTWGASGGSGPGSYHPTLAVASHVQRYCCVDVLLHLTCAGASREELARVLDMARSAGIRNVLALRGDPPRGKRSWGVGDVSGGGCDRAIDLVALIRERHGDHFGIGVAGHPEGHPSSGRGAGWRERELRHLEEKLDAGADFVLTQFFYDADAFLEYVRACRGAGIDCPIVPGILPVQSHASLFKMARSCGVSVPPAVAERVGRVRHDDEAVKRIGCEIAADASVAERVERVRNDDKAVKRIGCEIAADACRTILGAPDVDVDGFHFYTLNLERSATRVLAELGAVDVGSAVGGGAEPDGVQRPGTVENGGAVENGTSTRQRMERGDSASDRARPTRRVLPWKPSAMERRKREDVRPINWSNRPKSYVMRTEDWDEYPNGRWGDSTSPAFGELSDISHFYTFTLGSDEDRRAMLGTCPLVEQDVYEVFARYVEGTVPQIPWCETPLHAESFPSRTRFASLNRRGLLTVNSQPPVDGAPSDHPAFGWGGRGGRVYQKAYVECFASPNAADMLASMVNGHSNLNLYAVNHNGEELRSVEGEGGATALTWGVFPNREVLQPTIFDPDTFLVWAEEAFSLWSTMWLNLYEYESDSYDLIERIRDTYYLVAIIDNDFVAGGKNGPDFPLLDLLLSLGDQT
ncbi:hypothetical protein ACHAWF_018879 [Thalassiosira exigua]